MKRLSVIVFICFSIIIFTHGIFLYGKKNDKKKTESLESRTIPMLAFDSKGEPVFDLKSSDLEVFINGKLRKIEKLFRYFNPNIKNSSKNLETVSPLGNLGSEGTFTKCIIIDLAFCSSSGLEFEKLIAKKLITGRNKNEKFLVFVFDPLEGLKNLSDPNDGIKDLIDKIDGIELNFKYWSDKVFPKSTVKKDSEGEIASAFSKSGSIMDKNENSQGLNISFLDKIQKKYRKGMTDFGKILEKDDHSKIVFLLSETVTSGPFYDSFRQFTLSGVILLDKIIKDKKKSGLGFWSLLFNKEKENNFKTIFSFDMFEYIKNIVKSVNSENAILYKIGFEETFEIFKPDTNNLIKLRLFDGSENLNVYAGSDPANFSKLSKKIISAHYGIRYLTSKSSQINSVKVRCKRHGVNVVSIRYPERSGRGSSEK